MGEGLAVKLVPPIFLAMVKRGQAYSGVNPPLNRGVRLWLNKEKCELQ